MYEVLEGDGVNTRRNVVATRPTFEEAKSYVQGLGVVCLEDDADHAGCADAYTCDGRVLAIQPVGFKVPA